MSKLGIYLHTPFCDGKCPYCDFYSLAAGEREKTAYVRAAAAAVRSWQPSSPGNSHPARPQVHTVYFGGGTPNLLGAAGLADLLAAARERFSIVPDAEITLEANPNSVTLEFFEQVRAAGFNRLSMGLQSANADELALLGRKHTAEEVTKAVDAARSAGFENISLDLMLGLPGGSEAKLKHSIDFAASLGVEHISSYILKVEPGTPFAVSHVQLPEDDDTADQYLFCVEELARHGYHQYEISNFAKPDCESRHNLIYWHGEEYLGFGPAAHSFYAGKRFYYPRDLVAFCDGCAPTPDGDGGSLSEWCMLNLRLTEGVTRTRLAEKFGERGETAFAKLLQGARALPGQLVVADEEHLHFTPQGFLVSNALLAHLLDELETE